METTPTRTPSLAVGVALAAALVAVFLSILALGRALASGTVTVSEGGAGGGAPVPVSLTEFAIAPSTISVAEGGSLSVTNDGAAEHNLAVRDEDLTTPDLASGGTASLSVTSLSAGTYELLCTIPGHEAAGMVGTLVVGGEGTTSDPGSVGEELTGAARAEWLRANYEASVSAFPAETEGLGNQWYDGELQPDGTKLFELTLDEIDWEVAPGQFVHAVGYNGQVPGPALRMDVGDTVTIRIHNELDDQATTLHPHGVFMHPFEVDGVGYVSHDPTLPGEVYEVTFTTKEPSVGMYHGHDNGVEQVVNGAFGAWIVGSMPLPPEADNVVDERIMILNDAGNIGLTLNGKSFPATEPYVLKKGEQMVMHYYNEGLTPHPMHLHNNAQLVIAKDGYPLAQPYFVDTINVAPGERYTVVIFAEVPGVWVYHCHILTHVEKSDGSVFGMFTALIVEDSGDPELDADTGRDAGEGRNGTPSSDDGGESDDSSST